MEFIIIFAYIFIPIGIFVGGGTIGYMLEKNHYKDIHEREARLASVPCLSTKSLPADRQFSYAKLSIGSVVVSIDRFKQFLAALRNLFGGQVGAYASLIDRGRREAILRMKEAAPHADMFINVRLTTATMSSGGNKQMGTIEVMAYGTAIKFRAVSHVNAAKAAEPALAP